VWTIIVDVRQFDGQLTCALEEERFSRKKHEREFPWTSIERCLDIAGINPRDISHVALAVVPWLHWEKKLSYRLKRLARSRPFLRYDLFWSFYRYRQFLGWYKSLWPDRAAGPQVHLVPHHHCHAAGSFLVSPFDSAAILSIDGSGEWSTSLLGQGKGSGISVSSESYFPQSLGSFYEALTQYCGFKANYDEGKTMGLAPLGDPTRFYQQFRDMVRIGPDNSIHVDTRWFGYPDFTLPRFGPRWEQTFGPARKPDGAIEEHHQDAAAAGQRVLEECGLQMARQLHETTGERSLVIAGGVALNSVMNGRILRETPFEDVYVMAAAGDNGTAIGAAYYVQNIVLSRPRQFVHLDPYLGTSYDNVEIKRVLDEAKVRYCYHEDIAEVAADRLRQQRILGWFQGRMEIGPRALGNRSILADPTNPNMKARINAEVKHRESFRPFAPSVLVESRNRFFDIGVEDPFMLKVCNVLPEQRIRLPAITHVDGTARLQTVSSGTNPLYHRLISRFGELSGVPVILNTSFNIMGEPIVESPVNALRCFYSTGLDDLAIGNFLLSKE